ncbi:Asp23/Gls24 family envelope stress response protein, partial [Streptomyces cellulosae]
MTGGADRRPGIPRGERGAISVADRVVAKIASQVAAEVLSRFTESVGHVPPGRRTPRVNASVRRAPERTAGGDA